MISGNSRRLVADSNVILSAVMGKAALRVFVCYELELLTTEFNMAEVAEYIPVMAEKYGLEALRLTAQLRMLPLKVYKEAYYRSAMSAASKAMSGRDPDDSHTAALAIKEKVPVWSNYKDFTGVPGLTVVSTARLLVALEKLPGL